MILGLIAMTLCIVGIAGYYAGAPMLVFLGGIAEIAVILVGLVTKKLRSILTFALGVAGGLIYALASHTQVMTGIMLGICFESAVMGLIGSGITLYTLVRGHRPDEPSEDK